MADASGSKRAGLGKILFCIGIAGILISLALVFAGVFYTGSAGHAGYFWLSIIGFMVMGVSFIIIVAGAAGWFLESFAGKMRPGKRETGGSQSDYNNNSNKA